VTCLLSSVDGDADAAVETKIRMDAINSGSWYYCLIVRGRLYSMLHGSETWSVRKENEMAL